MRFSRKEDDEALGLKGLLAGLPDNQLIMLALATLLDTGEHRLLVEELRWRTDVPTHAAAHEAEHAPL